MAPKSNKKAAGGPKKGAEDEKSEEAFQAVIFADAWETRFNPFTLETPRCLLPLVNTPLIEYTLEFLAHNGLEQVFLYVGSHADQIEEYLGYVLPCLR
jgi:translation initiation factor eIF-2B subunit epsilon